MFSPRSVAVIGVGVTPDKVSHAIVDSIVSGGYQGAVYPVHPRHKEVLGLRIYDDIANLPEVPDLAVVALNQRASVDAVRRLSAMGVSGATVVAGGYAEIGADGAALQTALREAAGDMPIVGPNTLGFFHSPAKLNVTFYPRTLYPGNVSFLNQSGGIGITAADTADDERLGIAKWIGVGNRVNMEFHDWVEYLGLDAGTKVIGMFLEGSPHARALMERIRLVSREKPIVVYKGGRNEQAAKSTVTHTGAAAGPDALWSGALKQSGAFQVNSAAEMVTLCKALSIGRVPRGKRVAIFTHTAGPSIVALDCILEEPGCELPELGRETLDKIANILGPGVPVVVKNPVDGAAGAFHAEAFHTIARVILEDPTVDALLAISCKHKTWTTHTDLLIDLHSRFPQTMVACVVASQASAAQEMEKLHAAGIPAYATPEDAAKGLRALLSRASASNHSVGVRSG